MGRALVSLRGYNDKPVLLLVNFDTCEVERTMTPDIANLGHVPRSKVGFSGIAMLDGRRAAIALWDRIVLIDVDSQAVLEEYTDRRFSDLHSIHAEGGSRLWISNTNLDGVYTIDDTGVQAVWHAWECAALGETKAYVDRDYRTMVKEDIPYHTFHVNSVFADDTHIVCSFLGQRRRPGRLESLWRRAFPERRWGPIFAGGYLVLDRSTRALCKVVRCEGLHDSKRFKDGSIWSTQYFGRSLVRLDLSSLEIRTLRLDATPPTRGGYLTRGLIEVDDGFWIGHTVQRGWTDPNAAARLRKYSRAGRWTGEEIVLAGYVGVYDIVEWNR